MIAYTGRSKTKDGPPGRRKLIARYLRMIRKRRDGWRRHPEQLDQWKADGYKEGLHFFMLHLDFLARGELNAWTLADMIQRQADLCASSFGRSRDAIGFSVCLEACAVYFQPVARQLSGERRTIPLTGSTR